MDKQEVIQILNSAKPSFDRMYQLLISYAEMEGELNAKRIEREQGLSLKEGVITFLLGICYILPGVIYYRTKKKSKESRLNEEISMLENKLSEYDKELKNLANIIMKTGITNILPEKYLNPVDRVVNYLLDYFNSGRADSLKEALNLYEEDSHRLRMEQMQNEALMQSQEQSRLLRYNNIINAANAINNLTR